MNATKTFAKTAFFFGLLISLAIFSCSRHTGQRAGTQKMAERLKKLADGIDPKTNRFASAERVQYWRSRKPANAREQMINQFQTGMDLLHNGQTEEAIAELKSVLEKATTGPNSHMAPPRFEMDVREYLALAYLRLGEQDNCIARHATDSCLLPIRGSGVHADQRGSRAAIQEYSRLLAFYPQDLNYRWLLNIAHMTLGEYPEKVPEKLLIPPKVFDSDYDIKRFYDVAPRLGLDVMGLSGGSVMEDLDGDGDLDLMVSSWGWRDPLRAFRNNGDGTFTEMTPHLGLDGITGGLNMNHADYNNDGYPDIFVMRGAWLSEQGRQPNSLLRNNGNWTFDDVTEEAGVLSFHPTPTAAWGDYDNDGWLDLFIGNESNTDPLNLPNNSGIALWIQGFVGGAPNADQINPCELYHNNGDGTFTEVAAQAGVATGGFVKGAAWGDYNNDGRLDLYVSRLREPNVLYRNEGKNAAGQWSFKDVTAEAGVGEPLQSFPCWFFDFDNDGWLDIFVSGYYAAFGSVAADYLGEPADAERPRLYRNNHDGTFKDVTKEANVFKVLLTMGCNFGDLDNDGFLDFYAGTGDPDLRSLMPNRMFRNFEGKYFQDVTTAGGFGHLQKGHGVAFGDLDNDGDQDIFIEIGGALPGDAFRSALFENPGHGNRWITLKLEGTQSNRSAIGARIKVTVKTAGGLRDIYATAGTGGSFGSSSLQQEIGLGQATAIQTIEITWPATGKTQIFQDVAMEQIYKIREGDSLMTVLPSQRMTLSPATNRGATTAHSEH
ncbi:MAG: CRTAC1 family protein [candidate division KSB1 bacterium]|nr:CRTAC1 family protein [candidate division KSB1 bacterium]MDZ7367944.1 CRTAC1 family protein [candidate division KSB1 bacterium]MDZ7405567.1 CRTAC1 family protein [candidate division KSB1 bacterium]